MKRIILLFACSMILASCAPSLFECPKDMSGVYKPMWWMPEEYEPYALYLEQGEEIEKNVFYLEYIKDVIHGTFHYYEEGPGKVKLAGPSIEVYMIFDILCDSDACYMPGRICAHGEDIFVVYVKTLK